MVRERFTRKWETFSGRNKFYCDGRLMTAPHSGVFILTVVLITGTSVLFFIFDCKYLAENVTVAIPIVGAVLFVFTMSSLLRTSLSDPGIIPRATAEEAAYVEKQIEVTNSTNSPTYRPPPRTKEVLIKGQTIKLKYCFTCKIFRPPRASHCSLCDNCVDRFDHHCPWVGNCVGRRNYRFFYMFIVSLAFLAVFIFACSIAHLILLTNEEKPFLEAVKESPPSLIVAGICFFSVWSILGLAGFHTYLTTSNQTTNEDIKGSFTGKQGHGNFNPYSQGNICLNCLHILCGPVAPSLVDRRGVVTDDYRNESLPQPISMQPLNQPSHIYGATFGNYDSALASSDIIGVYKQTAETTDSNAGSVTHLVGSEQPLAVGPVLQRMQIHPLLPYASQPNLTSSPSSAAVPVYSNLATAQTAQPSQVVHTMAQCCQNVSSSAVTIVAVSSNEANKNLAAAAASSSSAAEERNAKLPAHNMVTTVDSHLNNVKTKMKPSAATAANNNNSSYGGLQETDNSLSASRLRLLQDTTMIESALDLDSLDGSSLGTNSQAGLMKIV